MQNRQLLLVVVSKVQTTSKLDSELVRYNFASASLFHTMLKLLQLQ